MAWEVCLFGLQIAVHVDLKLSDSSRIAYVFLYELDLKAEHVQDRPFGSGSGAEDVARVGSKGARSRRMEFNSNLRILQNEKTSEIPTKLHRQKKY